MINGGYDDGYCACPCFWGTDPGSFVKILAGVRKDFSGIRVLDAGCGEGKNAVYLARQGAAVDAVDVSEPAIQNGRQLWPAVPGVRWRVADIRESSIPEEHYDVVIAYGLLHCLRSADEWENTLAKLKRATHVGGHFVLCAFNSRRQDLKAHPGFEPCLMAHSEYLAAFSSWKVLVESDSDLVESHPHNNIEHTHALTRMLAQKVIH